MQKIFNYINGQLVEPVSKKFIDNVDPSIGEVYSQIPDSDERDVADAVTAARAAFDGWAGMQV
ncbi:MAG TPA: aldehyde dehydrogenase family protein, partial [Cyclobacteriaceae bacterium]|nr:aldehyde dehydrogenase family protein [Cyclobacteriaceae bacterium]